MQRAMIAVLAVAGVAIAAVASHAAGPIRRPATRLSSGPDTVVVFGPNHYVSEYEYGGSAWTVFAEEFSIADFDSMRWFVFRITNGDAQGQHRVAQVSLVLNGCEVMNASDVTGTVSFATKVVTPEANNTLQVSLRSPFDPSQHYEGDTDTYIDLDLISIPNPSYYDVYPSTQFTVSQIPEEVEPGGESEDFSDSLSKPASAAPPYYIVLTNGTAGGSSRVTSARVWLNGTQVVSPAEFDAFTARLTRQVTLLSENSFTVRAVGTTEGETYFSVAFTATDTTPPVVTVNWPPDSLVTAASKVGVNGSVSDETHGTVRVNEGTAFATPGSFADSVTLATDGRHTITVHAVNGGGYATDVVRTVIRDTQAPTLTVTWPPESPPTINAENGTVTGSWSDLTRTIIYVDGDSVRSGAGGTFSIPVPLDLGPNGILVRAKDALGNSTQIKRFVFRGDPNEPTRSSDVDAPPLPTTEITPFLEAVQFLYTGASPQQDSVIADSIKADRAAVVRGRVYARDIGPLPNVTVRVLGYPEFGWTLTRSDGQFDLVVNGGQALTLRVIKPGYLESQRAVVVPCNEHVCLDSLALIGKSSRFTVVDMDSAAQAVRSRFESDANGDRHLTMLFEQGSTARVIPAPGDTVPFTAVRVRAKEYTVGRGGADAMPAELPASTAYTYCVDLSLDEADSLGQAGAPPPEVRLSKPVACYVKDFLHLPVGGFIPAGYYDPRHGQWVASEDGCVIKILGISNGLATVDADTISGPDTQEHLDTLGIDDAERAQLASQYAVGDTLWRIRVDHLSTWDFNLNLAQLAYERSPAAGRARRLMRLVQGACEFRGSIIECENRTLGERVPIVGTPYTLNYRSYRTPGDKAMRRLRVPIGGSLIPSQVQKILLVVDVAGQRIVRQYVPPCDSVAEIQWDGLDAFGRPVQGAVNARISIGYEYAAAYAMPASPGGASLGDPASSGMATFGAIGDRAVGRISWARQTASLGAPSMGSAGLGSWTLSPHHFYDVTGSGTLYFGDGELRAGDQQYLLISKYAGTGQLGSPTIPNDCEPSALSLAITPYDLAFAPSGELFFIEGTSRSIRKIDRQGRVCRVAGTGATSPTYNGDGMSAKVANLGEPKRLAIGPDGTVYFVDAWAWSGLLRVRKVTPDGIIHTIAGDGQQNTSPAGGYGDGGPATAARFTSLDAIALGPDGSVFVADHGGTYHDNRVRRISPGGVITTYAGSGLSGSSVEWNGVKATQVNLPDIIAMTADQDGNLYLADGTCVHKISPDGRLTTITGASGNFHPWGVCAGDDGALYITSHSEGRVYHRDPDGTLTSIAGVGANEDHADADNLTPAAGARLLYPRGVAMAPDGSVYITEERRVRRIGPFLPDRTQEEFSIPAEDGSERYVFSSRGRHLRTLDGLTGVVRCSFAYDGSGRLDRVIDANGDTTRIERDVLGNPTGIIGPYGHRTALEVDGDGFLTSITNPANERIRLTPRSDGLLAEFWDAKNQLHRYTYGDDDGRLVLDENPAGGSQTLAGGDAGIQRTVTRTSGENHTTTYLTKQYFAGFLRRVVTGPDNHRTALVDTTDSGGQVVISLRQEGDSLRVRTAPEPRFGMLAPIDSGSTVVLPNGLKRNIHITRPYSASNFDPPSLTTGNWQQVVNVNGNPYTMTYVPGTRTLTLVSPENRTATVVLDVAGRPVTLSTPGTAPTNLDYDGRGRLWHLTQDVRVWRYEYDDSGRVARVVSPIVDTTGFRYDAADRVIRQTLPGGRMVGYAYDLNGNLVTVTPPGQPSHTFDYSPVDLVQHYTPPDVGEGGTTTTYTYNLDGQLKTVEFPDNATVQLDYDGVGRLWTLSQARGASVFGYLATTGQLSSVTSPDSVVLGYSYNGPLMSSETWSGRVAGTVAGDHNSELLPRFQTVNGTGGVNLAYDHDGLLTGAEALTIHRRDEDGRVDSTRVELLTHSQDYNAYGELANLRYAWNDTALFQQSLTRDALGRITRLEESAFGADTVYGYRYDNAGRLYAVTTDGDTTARYWYDANGNRVAFQGRTSADTATATYDAQDRLVRYRDTHYSYTATGELAQAVTGTQTTHYTYDALGNLLKVVLASGDSVEYVVDGLNRRVGRKVNGAWTHRWVYQNELNVVAEVNSAGAVVSRYVYGTRGHVPDYVVQGETTYRLITDQLGSVRGVVNVADGSVAERMDYDAWGVVKEDTAPGFVTLGYAGGLMDSLTGLVRFGARDYDAVAGRWTARDQDVVDLGAPNTYAYVRSEPVNGIDPAGQFRSHPVLRALVPGQVEWDATVTSLEQARYLEAGLHLATVLTEDVFLALGLTEMTTACRAGRLWTIQDMVRFDSKTIVPPRVIGPRVAKPQYTWAIKGGGVNPETGLELPFHYHIHKWNLQRPWEWFKYTPMR